MKAQVAMEYLIILGFAFLLTAPLLIIFYTQSNSINDDVTASQSAKAAAEIIDAADQVYYYGAPSQKTISLYFPQNIKEITCSGKALVMKISAKGGTSEIVSWSAGNISAPPPGPAETCLKTYSGNHNIVIRAWEDPLTNLTGVYITD
jgi:uncharacterized protein (UPF0333 family)